MGLAVVVMGVQGSGKSTVGAELASRLGVDFVDGDDLHPPRNKQRMAAGIPLDDADRAPWLREVGEVLAREFDRGVVVACSALKRRYRDAIRDREADVYFVELWGPIEIVAARIAARNHAFMPATLLASQYEALESLAPDENGVRVSLEQESGAVVDEALRAIRANVSR